MSLTRQIAHNTIIQFTSKVIAIILGVATIAVMARYLGKEGYGLYTTVTAYLQLFAIIIDFGLSITIIKLIAETPDQETQIANNVLSFRLVSALIFLGMAPTIALFFPYPYIVKIGIAITTLAFLFNSLNQILISLFQKYLRMDQNSASEVIGRLFLFGLVAGAAYLNYGLLGVLVAQIVASFITLALNFIFMKKWIAFRLVFDPGLWRRIWGVTWPIAISIAFNLVYYKADTLILSLTRSQGEVGIYGATYRVLEILTQFPFMFVGLIFPVLSTAYSLADTERYKRVLQKAFDFMAIAALPLIAGTLFVAQPLMIFISGPQFADAGTVLKIIIFATAIIFMNAIFGYNIVAINKQKTLIWAYIFTAALSVILYLIYIPIYSYFAAAVITVLTEALMLFFNLLISYKATRYLPNLKTFGKALLASLIMAVPLYLLIGQNLFILLIVGALTYSVALYLLRGITKQTILEIIRFKT